MFVLNRRLSSICFAFIGWISCTLTSSFALHVGVVDDMAVLQSSSLQALVKPKEAKLNAGAKELKEMAMQFQKAKAEFDKNEMIMEEKTREQKQKALLNLSKQFQNKMIALEKEREVVQHQMEQRVQDACIKLVKQQKFNLLLSKKGGVLYADPALDVTTQVVNMLPNSKMAVNATINDELEVKNQASTA